MQSGKAKYQKKYVRKGERQEGEGQDQGQEGPKRQRAPRFAYPKDWKEELEKTVNLETKIPVAPRDDELVAKPDFDALRSNQNSVQKKIEQLYNQMDKLKNEQKQIRDEERNKNNSGFTELKAKQAARKELSDQLKANKEQKEKIQKELEKIEDKTSKLSKKAVGGKILPKQKLEEMIRVKEEEFKNSKHTAAEEKKWIEEINELKKNLPLMNESESHRKERDGAQEKLNHLKKEGKVLFDKIQALSGTINEMREKLGLNKPEEQGEGAKGEGKKKERGEKGENDVEGKEQEKKEKPQRELGEAEKKLKEQRDKLFEEVLKLKEKKEELSKKFDQDAYEYEKQQFELRKIEKMTKIQKKLRYDENKKKRAEEDEKYRAQEEEKAKELLQFKYSKEIDTCDSLAQILKGYLPSDKSDNPAESGNGDASYKVDDKMLKDENLVLIKPKKASQNEGIQPGQKKTQKKNKPKKGDEKDKEDGRLLLDIATLQTFNDIKVMPPANVAQIDAVVQQLKDKKAYYEKLREDEMERAFAPKTAGESNQEKTEAAPAEKKERRQERQEGQEEKPKKQAKVEMNDEDFPSLN